MKVYAIVLIVCGCVLAALIILCCLCKGWGRKTKQRKPPTPMRSVAVPSVKQANYVPDVERGGTSSGNTKDGNMVILAGAGAALATVAVVDSIIGDGGGSGGDGGGGCGGCGGCGG